MSTPSKALDLNAIRKMVKAEDRLDWKVMAKELNISLEALRTARDVIYLMEEELTGDEWAAVAEAVKLIAKVKVKAAEELIAPVMFRHFGGKTSAYGSPLEARDAAVKRFIGQTTAIVDTMNMSADIVAPWMPPEDRKYLEEEIREGVRHVESLLVLIQNGGTHNAGS